MNLKVKFNIINGYNKSVEPFMENGSIVASKDELSNLLNGKVTKEDLANLIVPVALDLLDTKVDLIIRYRENMESFTDCYELQEDSDVFDIDENNIKTSRADKIAKKDAIECLQALFDNSYNYGEYTYHNSDKILLDYMCYKRGTIKNMIKQIPLIRDELSESSEFYSLICYLILLVQSELIRSTNDSLLHSTVKEPTAIKNLSDNTLNVLANVVMNVACKALKSDSNIIKRR